MNSMKLYFTSYVRRYLQTWRKGLGISSKEVEEVLDGVFGIGAHAVAAEIW